MRVRRLDQIPDVVLLEPTVHEDARGYFMEVWNARRCADAGLELTFVQDNQSGSQQRTLRGLHYQIAQPQGKLVRTLYGEIFDVAVDIRRSSSTFAKWAGIRLSAANRLQLYVPPGFAHGFLVLSDRADVEYKCTEFYAPEHERTLLWNDPDIGIQWPLPREKGPILSSNDLRGALLRNAEVFA